jgi:hypothetical protein
VAVRVHLPQIEDTRLADEIAAAVKAAIAGRAETDDWFVSIFRSQDGQRWDVAVRGPRCRAFLDCSRLEAASPAAVAALVRRALEQRDQQRQVRHA